MRKTIRICLLAGMLALCLLLSACAAPKMQFEASEQGYVLSGEDTVYLKAPKTYVASALDTEKKLARLILEDGELAIYAACGVDGGKSMDTSVWLADENYGVYYASGTALPMLWEMRVNRISIVQRSTESFSMGEITEQADILSVIDEYQNGETYSFAALNFEMSLLKYERDYNKYDLIFSSETYPGISYALILYHFESDLYLETEDEDDSTLAYSMDAGLKNIGRNVILDPVTRKCYAVENVFDGFFKKAS